MSMSFIYDFYQSIFTIFIHSLDPKFEVEKKKRQCSKDLLVGMIGEMASHISFDMEKICLSSAFTIREVRIESVYTTKRVCKNTDR